MRPDPADWENRAIRIAASLDAAADELAQLINDFRESRNERDERDQGCPDDRPKP